MQGLEKARKEKEKIVLVCKISTEIHEGQQVHGSKRATGRQSLLALSNSPTSA